MRVIIIEGPDNSGKNTLIHNIIDNHDVVKVIHCHKPERGDSDPFSTMKRIYLWHAEEIIRDKIEGHVDVVVFNRYHISEYVYGQMYRNGNPEAIKEMIDTIDEYLINNIGKENIYYVQLYCTAPSLLIKHEDGLSLSGGSEERIKTELEKFEEIYQYSKLNKIKIRINDGEGNFNSRGHIVEQFKKFIYESE